MGFPTNWRLTFLSPRPLKFLVNLVEPTVLDVTFRVCLDEGISGIDDPFTGIRLDCTTRSQNALIRLWCSCEIYVSSPELSREEFCVDLSKLKLALGDVPDSGVVVLTRHADVIEIRHNTTGSELITLKKDPPPLGGIFDVCNHAVPISTKKLRDAPPQITPEWFFFRPVIEDQRNFRNILGTL
jgi:hypothetical protein